MKFYRFVLSLIPLFHPIYQISAQEVPFSSDRWDIQAEEYEITEFKGQETLTMKGGIAYLRDVEFLNGTIEFDISLPAERGFMGAVWRLQDRQNYEEFYLRPHQSGNPDANQYTPVFNGLAAWQLYYGEGYGKPVTYVFDEWIHVKIVIDGLTGEVYINDMNEPALTINEMKRKLERGSIGVEAGNFSAGRFANFKYEINENPALKSRIKAPEDAVYGTILKWEVSDPFPFELVRDKIFIEKTFINARAWTETDSENSGITNLAKLNGLSEGNTVMVRLMIDASADQMKALQFGYSDIAQVYVNNLILYSGQHEYQSRDYRYLGTMGYFDTVYLPLQKGLNELIITVTENFGGWGIMGKFSESSGIAY